MIKKANYVINEILKNYDDKLWWKQRVTNRVIGRMHSVYPGYRNGISVMDEEWDTLIILDACRYDLFEEIVDIDQFHEYNWVESLGSATPEWLQRNFVDKKFGDTVYVSGNPQVSKHAADCFHDLIPVWKNEFTDADRNVLPGSVTDAAIEAHDTYPDKRVIVHYMQPHVPFITTDNLFFGGMYTPKDVISGDPEFTVYDGARNPWEALELGIIEFSELWKAYSENLAIAMDSVWRLIKNINGRLVVSSDHGNLIGEFGWPVPLRLYGHPTGIRTANLVRVPWAVIEDDRRIIQESGTTTVEGNNEQIKKRLRDLGYK